jgi:hypothetical protein
MQMAGREREGHSGMGEIVGLVGFSHGVLSAERDE